MPRITYKASIDVRAPADVAFAIIAADIVASRDDPNPIDGQRPLVAGPIRDGFVWEQVYVHNRRVCHTWTVCELHPGRRLTQTMHHLCMQARRETRGGERWEFADRTATGDRPVPSGASAIVNPALREDRGRYGCHAIACRVCLA